VPIYEPMQKALAAVVVLLLAGAAFAGVSHARRGTVAVDEIRALPFADRATGPLLLDAFVPATAGPHPAVVLVHGGGWRSGTRTGWSHTGRALAVEGIAAFSIDYRLSGEAVFPAARNDVLDAVRWIRSNSSRFDIDPARIGLLGGSAGANLSLLAATLGDGALDRDARVAAVVAWSPPVDLTAPPTPLLEELTTAYLGCDPARCPSRAEVASPATHVDPSDPPALVVTSDAEIVPLGEAERMVAELGAAEVDHRLVILTGDAHASDYRDEVWSDTVSFLKTHLAGASG
jgi:acetyl esterase